MSVALLISSATFFLEHQNLVILQMLQDLALYYGAFYYRCADFDLTVVVCEQDFVETYGRIFFALETVNIKFPTFFSLELLTCDLYYNVHLIDCYVLIHNSECKYRDNSRNCKGCGQKKSREGFWHGFGRASGGTPHGSPDALRRLVGRIASGSGNIRRGGFVCLINFVTFTMAEEISEIQNRVTMINDKVRMYLLPPLFNAAVRAGAAAMEVYRHRDDYEVSPGSDRTPITVADRLAHRVIREYLGPTRIPILSEEGRAMLYDERRNWELYWLVDPLDGTVEFLGGNNEFTVNIALMENNVCMGSVIYVPYYGKMYVAGRGSGSYLKESVYPDADASYDYDSIVTGWHRLPFSTGVRPAGLRVAVSRSHQTPETHAHIDRLRRLYPSLEVVEQGSSYKFCLLAEGSVDYYVRTTHTLEWDTAAGELILSESGGATRSFPDGGALRYNEEDLHNPWFVCRSKHCPSF